MPLYVADYRADTAHLSAAQHGAYLLLIMHYWATGSLPNDDGALARIACMLPAEWKKNRATIAGFFAPDWTHKRIDEELARARELSSKRAAIAKQRHSKSSAIAEQLDTQSQSQSLKEDRIVEARAGGSSFTEGSKALADAFWRAVGITDKLQIPPQFAGIDWRAIEWERAGFTVDLIEAEAKRVGPDKPLNYHEKVFATAFAKRQAPLPVVEVREAEKITVTRHGTSNSQSGSLIASIKRELAEIEAEESADLALPANDILRLSDGSVRRP